MTVKKQKTATYGVPWADWLLGDCTGLPVTAIEHGSLEFNGLLLIFSE